MTENTDHLFAEIDRITKSKASYLVDHGMVVTGLILTRKETGEKCSINLGRVNWASVQQQNIKDFGAQQRLMMATGLKLTLMNYKYNSAPAGIKNVLTVILKEYKLQAP